MGGWKTKVASVGGMLGGVGLVIAGLLAEPMNFEEAAAGWAMIVAGLAVWGIGHKVEKGPVKKH